MRRLTNLKFVRIDNCQLLKERCTKESGPELNTPFIIEIVFSPWLQTGRRIHCDYGGPFYSWLSPAVCLDIKSDKSFVPT
ncbi:hypothetical protein F0562_000085 [Nyssa sinensis]|uniref:Uncharacterized protein n=1 Tax=Nyssa sinensis TaxID=561372 RepID=A0A5J5C468_9ASTE|nr:hypothetical protein F0562_000085 [Nyssa sinensis]